MLSQRPWVWYDYVTLGFDFISGGLGACGTLAVSPDITGRPGKSFLHLVQSPLRVIIIGKSLAEVLHFLLKEFRIATDSFGPMGEGTNDTIFC